MEREFSAFFGGLEGAFVDVFQLGKGQLFLAVVEVASVRAGGGRSDQWFMVTKDVFVIQIKIIVADADRAVLVFAKSIVKGGVQMVVLSVNPDNIPGVAVFDPFFRIVSADGDDAPDTKGIAEHFYRFGDSLTDAYAVSKRPDDLVGVWLFQLVVADIFADKVVDIFFLIPLGKLHGRAYKLVYAGAQSFLGVPDLILVKDIFRDQDQIWRIFVIAVFEPHGPEDLRMIQSQLEKHIIEPVSVGSGNLWDQKFVGKFHKSVKHCAVHVLFIFWYSAVIIFFSLFHIFEFNLP